MSSDGDDNDHRSDLLTTPTRSPQQQQQHHHHHHHDALASNPSQSPSVFGKGNPKWRVEEKEDPSRYVRWTAYDKPVEFPTAVQALVTRRGWTNPWTPASPLGKLAEAKRCVRGEEGGVGGGDALKRVIGLLCVRNFFQESCKRC